MRKKILFVIPEYSYGGTNKSLQNLVGLLNKNKYEIHILSLYEDGGIYYKKIFEPFIIKKGLLYHILHDNRFTRKILGLYRFINKKDRLEWLYKHEAIRLQRKYRFDIVVGYQELLSTEFISFFKNTHLIAWVQCDYPVLVGRKRYKRDLNYYNNIDDIVCVSKSCAESLKVFFPMLSQKIIGIHNTINTDLTIKMSKENQDHLFEDNCFNIISVGRLHKEKGFEKIPSIIRQVKRVVNKNVKWFIIGSGVEEYNIKIEIKINDVEENVFLLGKKDNPYPYMANADLYVCMSTTESFSYTIAEAKILHTPILCNTFPVAYEVIGKNNGIICQTDKMAKTIAELVDDVNGIYSNLVNNSKTYKYDNSIMIKEIEGIFDKKIKTC